MTGGEHQDARRRCRGEAGQAAGAEVVPFGFLVLVAGALLVANLWGVVDARATAASAAREATRAFVEAPTTGDGDEAATAAAATVVEGAGRDPSRLTLVRQDGEDFTRCRRITYEAGYPVPALRLPWIGGFGQAFVARARHSEIVDPFRSGLSGEASCAVAP